MNWIKHNILTLCVALTVLAGLVCFMPTASLAQETEEDIAVCKVGLNTCAPLKDKEEKYKRCMKIVCADAAMAEKAQKKPIKECEVGYRKCDSLRDEPLYYWTCVTETCENPPSTDVSCPDGHKHPECVALLEQYWLCMGTECNTIYDSFETCDIGINECVPRLSKYWECVSRRCLGSVDKYRDPEYYKDNPKSEKVLEYIKQKNKRYAPPNYTAPPLRGVPDWMKFAPKGVNPYDWSAVIVAPSRQVRGNAIEKYRCRQQGAIHCQSADISSCTCSDGRPPFMRTEVIYVKDLEVERYRRKYRYKDLGPYDGNSY